MALVVWADFDEPTNRRTVRVGATTDSRCHVSVISLCSSYGFVPIFPFLLFFFSFFHFIVMYVSTNCPVGFIAVGLTAAAVLSGAGEGSCKSSLFPPTQFLNGLYHRRETGVSTRGPQL